MFCAFCVHKYSLLFRKFFKNVIDDVSPSTKERTKKKPMKINGKLTRKFSVSLLEYTSEDSLGILKIFR